MEGGRRLQNVYIDKSSGEGTERVIGINHILAYTRASDENTYVDIQGNLNQVLSYLGLPREVSCFKVSEFYNFSLDFS